MPQSHNADYSNSQSCNASQNGQYGSNTSMLGQIPLLNSSVQTQNLMAAAMHLNQPNQGYMASAGMPTLGYIYPHNNSFVQASNLIYNPHNALHPPVEMMPSGPSSLGHIGNTSSHHNHKLSGYDNMQHFGSLSQNSSRKPKNSVMSKTNLYINGLQESDTDESVRALVEGIIDPKSCKAMMSHGKCRGSGFIDCTSENDAEAVIQILRNKQMPGGTRLAVKFAYENEKDDLNVYVRNLPRTSSFNNNNLEELFKEFGQVISVKLLQSDNQYTGTGFVRFSAAEEAQKAVDYMNSKKLILTEEDKPVICKLADKGGRRMNHHSMHMTYVESSYHQPHAPIGESGESLCNGNNLGSKISTENNALVHSQYNNQGHPWLNHSNPDVLVQELQSLGLAQSAANYLLPGLIQGSVYPDEVTFQQQQLLAQIIWANQNPSRMLTANAAYHQSQIAQHHPPPNVLQWPPQQSHHHPTIAAATNNNVYYTSDHYQSLLYPQQYRHPRPTAAVTNNKSPSTIDAVVTVNGQSSQATQLPLLNGSVTIDPHQSKM